MDCHLLWDLKKMVGKVTAFEIELGFKKSDVERAYPARTPGNIAR